MPEYTLSISGQVTLNDVSSIVRYGDIKRTYTVGGISVTGQATLNELDSNAYFGDLRRVYTAGGISVSGEAELNLQSDFAHFGDIRRVYTPGGLIISGHANLNDVADNFRFGDLMKICFVTLEDITDNWPILLNVAQLDTAVSWLQDAVTTIAWCWKITRQDGTVMGFTSHDVDIVLDGVTYKAKTGFAPTAVSTSDDMSVDNLDADGMISDESITTEDLRSGLYNNADIEVFLCNYEDLTEDIFILRRGSIGEVNYGDNKFTAEIRGLMEAYSQKSGKITSKSCRTYLGSSLCKIAMSAFTETGTVTAVDTDGFYISNSHEADYFTYGVITWLTGLNKDTEIEVKKYSSNGYVELFLPMSHNVGIGDTFSIVAGCDGNATTCRSRFNNLTNFRGEPYTPGNNYAVNYPVSTAGNIVSEGESPKRAVYDWGD